MCQGVRVVTSEGNKAKKTKKDGNGATVGFEEKLFAAADRMRGHMDPAEYKHVALGLIFLKYISDAFEERHAALQQEQYADPESPDEYRAENVFWVPPEARWAHLQANAKQPTIGKFIDDAMITIERDNPSLKGILSKDYSRPTLDKQRLGELIDLIGTISLGGKDGRSKDILGRVYEYFLGRFAGAEGKGGGEFYTPQSVVRLLVEMIEPYRGRIYDPCEGSGGMFVQSEKFVEAHGGTVNDLSVYGQESNPTTWRLCKMNLAIRGIEGRLGDRNADTFHDDLHKDLKADYILANPPFNISVWGGERLRDDVRWKYGTPPTGNANYAWMQHMVHHLAPNGVAGFVMANGSLSTNTGNEGTIRTVMIESDLVDCIVALPGQLFYTTSIQATLWFLARNKRDPSFRDRRGQTLFIYAQNLGHLTDRTHRELTNSEIDRIAHVYHLWRDNKRFDEYSDIPGFCKSATVDQIRDHKMALVPGRYVGFDKRLYEEWDHFHLQAELEELEARLARNNEASKAALFILQELLHG